MLWTKGLTVVILKMGSLNTFVKIAVKLLKFFLHAKASFANLQTWIIIVMWSMMNVIHSNIVSERRFFSFLQKRIDIGAKI